jgi:hypothetical protein
MGRKHGGVFGGFKPVMSSSSNIFARRGDPWITEREGVRDFNRTREIENPDADADRQRHFKQATGKVDFSGKLTVLTDNPEMDQFTQASKAQPRPTYRDWHKKPDVVVEVSKRRRLTNICLKMNSGIRAAQPHRVAEKSNAQIPCPYGCGYTNADSRMVSRHVRENPDKCCTMAEGDRARFLARRAKS